MLRFCDMPNASVTCFRKSKVNIDLLSDTILLGSLWGLTVRQMKWSARSSGFMVPSHAMKCPILVSRSITTHRAFFLLLGGNVVMKSVVIASQGQYGSSSSLSSPNKMCRIGLIRR